MNMDTIAPASENFPLRLNRRAAIKWMLAAAGSALIVDRFALAASPVAGAKAVGYGTDPDLLKNYRPGDLWALTFTEEQRRTAAVLCETIIPADGKSPSAAALGVHDFIDEWISAPYPGHDRDRALVLEGLAWLDAEARRRFQFGFATLVVVQKNAICDDICHPPKAKPEFKKAAQFFARFRDLTAGGFYTTPEGMKDIGYVGNVASATFDGPPPEALRRLGLA